MGAYLGLDLEAPFQNPGFYRYGGMTSSRGLTHTGALLPEWRGVREVADVKCHALTMERGSETVVFLISQVTFQWLPGAFMTGGHS